MPDRRAQPQGAGGAVVLTLCDDVCHPDGGLVAQLRQGAEGHVAGGEVSVEADLDAAGAELFQQLVGAPVHSKTLHLTC